MVQGMISLLKNCPQEVAHLRRELLIAARHILATDLRSRFVTCIDQLFDENLLIGLVALYKSTCIYSKFYGLMPASVLNC
jgi:hypothetical protein